jgi:hypothetical protein
MNHKLANGMNMWKGNGNTTKLLFSLKGLDILHLVRRGQVNTIVMENFNRILFQKSRPANKQHTLCQAGSIQGRGDEYLDKVLDWCQLVRN